MPKTDRPASKGRNSNNPEHFFSGGFWLAILLSVALIGFVAYVSFCGQGDISNRWVFFVTSLLNALIFGAIVFQAFIYSKQWAAMREALKQGREALQISERAYVGVYSLDRRELDDDTMQLRIENLGRLPAHDITVRVDIILLRREHDPLTAHWHWDFERTNLFRGNLKIDLLVPLADKLEKKPLQLVRQGEARMIAQIRIEYRDGFEDTERQRADYAFRFRVREWLSWPTWTDDAIDARCQEENRTLPRLPTQMVTTVLSN